MDVVEYVEVRLASETQQSQHKVDRRRIASVTLSTSSLDLCKGYHCPYSGLKVAEHIQ